MQKLYGLLQEDAVSDLHGLENGLSAALNFASFCILNS